MKLKTTPRRHQLETFECAKLEPNWACFWQVGLGKSYMAMLFALHHYQKEGRILPTIIFAPPRPVPGWKKQWCEHTDIPEKNVVLLLGTGKQRVKIFEKARLSLNDEVIFVTNYESLLMKDLFLGFKDLKPRVLVFDEAHRLKNPQAKRSQLADDLANPYDTKRKCALPRPNTYILTGSPVLNSLMDVFMQFKILDGGKTFGWNFWAFRARFFRDRNAHIPKAKYFPNWEVMTKEKDGFDGVGELQKLMSSSSNYIEKKDCLDLPPEMDEVIEVSMSIDQARAYKEMRQDLITFYESKVCVASLAITRALRLMQIVSGFVSVQDIDGQERELKDFTDCPRIEAYKEWLEEMLELGQNVLVWAVFKHNYVSLKKATLEVFEKLKSEYRVVECHGGLSSSQQDQSLKQFRDDVNTRVFIGHPKSGGIGVNELMKAGVDLTYSRDFSLESYIQSRGRNHRDGSDKHGHRQIIHYNMICRDTIDEISHQKLANKENMGDKLLADIISSLKHQGG